MGTTLVIRDEASWTPQSGVFETALEAISKAIRPKDLTLAMMIAEPIGDFAYLSLRNITAQQFSLLLNTVTAIFIEAFQNWGTNRNVDHYSFLCRLSQFKTMLLLDPLVDQADFETKTIVINHNDSWSVPGWIRDALLECLIAWLRTKDYNDLAAMLLPVYFRESNTCDFSNLNDKEFQALLPFFSDMYMEYHESADGRGRECRSLAFLGAFAPQVIRIYRLIHSDTRAMTKH